MVPYHGTPITPNITAVKVCEGRHMLVSFAEPRQIAMVAELAQSFALDNGAFTTWTQGKTYDLVGYYRFVAEWVGHPGYDWSLIPDIIDGRLQDNKNLIYNWPFCKSQGVPVWHLHEPLHWLEELAFNWPRIAIGSSGEYAKIGTPSWFSRMRDAFSTICVGGVPITKVHGLRMLDPEIFTKFPFASCDSANVARNHNDPSRLYRAKHKGVNHAVMIHNIEKNQSAPLFAQARITKGESNE